jgi:serine/threonine protein kinase
MTPVQWEEVKARFHQALLIPPEMRHDFLAVSWPDEVVRAEVERLLTQDGPGDFSLSIPAHISGTGHSGGPFDPAPEFTNTGRFECVDQLGAGTFGIVYRVFDRERNSLVALKKLVRCDARSLMRFKREFRLLADPTHPNLVQLYELFGEGPDWFFTMELVQGVDFLSHVRQSAGVFSWDRLREALYQLTAGVTALHSFGRLHRDLKPSNVLVEASGRVVILDFGLVRALGGDSAEQTATLAGSPAYMAPEQAAGLATGEAADWYAVGVMLFKALTGRLPFTGEWKDVLTDKQRERAPRSRDFAPDIPEDLDEACEALLQRDPTLRLRGRDILQGYRTQERGETGSEDEFVGRHEELRLMHARFASATAGKGQTVFVRGQSGIGKSSFLSRFLGEIKRDRSNTVILKGRCREAESVPYKALDPIVDELVKYLQRLPEEAASALMPRSPELLRRLFPVFTGLALLSGFPDKPMAHLDENQIRQRAFEALRELFGRMSDRGPVVISIDDVQWGDLDSIAFLSDLVLAANAPALLLVLAFRSERAEDNPSLRGLFGMEQRLADADAYQAIELTGLPEDEGGVLLRLLRINSSPISDEQSRELLQESAGSPLLLKELVRFAARTMEAGGPATPSRGVRISEMIRYRAETMSVTARQLLEVLSVAGEPISRTLLYRAVQGAQEDPAKETALLIRDHLARFTGGPRGAELEPFHDQVREAVLSWISAADLTIKHSLLAALLENEPQVDPERILRHYRGAGNLPAAFRTAIEAAKTAESALAFEQAARFYGDALATEIAGERQQSELYLKRADALVKAGRGYEAAQCYLKAAPFSAGNDKLEMLRAAAEQLIRSGNMDEGTQLLATLLRTAGIYLPESRMQTLLRMLILRVFIRIRGLNWRERTEAEVSPDLLRRLDLLWGGAMALASTEPISGSYLQALHMIAALRAGEPYRLAVAFGFAAFYETVGGTRKYAHGRKLVGLAQQLAERLDDTYLRAMAAGCRAAIDFLTGRIQEGLPLAQTAVLGLQSVSRRWRAWEIASFNMLVVWFLGWGGRLRELTETLPLLADEGRARGDLYTEVYLRCSNAAHLIQLAADQPERALTEISDNIKRWRTTSYDLPHLHAVFGSAESLLYAGSEVQAHQLLVAEWEFIRKSLYTRSEIHRTTLFFLRGRIALAIWRQDPDQRKLLAEIRLFAKKLNRLGSQWGAAFNLILLAGIMAGQRRRGDALRLLESAEKILREQDLRLIAAAVLRRRGELLGDSGVPLVKAADDFMKSENILRPDRMTAMFLPGNWPATG